jgi:hypothetical protein
MKCTKIFRVIYPSLEGASILAISYLHVLPINKHLLYINAIEKYLQLELCQGRWQIQGVRNSLSEKIIYLYLFMYLLYPVYASGLSTRAIYSKPSILQRPSYISELSVEGFLYMEIASVNLVYTFVRP